MAESERAKELWPRFLNPTTVRGNLQHYLTERASVEQSGKLLRLASDLCKDAVCPTLLFFSLLHSCSNSLHPSESYLLLDKLRLSSQLSSDIPVSVRYSDNASRHLTIKSSPQRNC